MRPMLPKSAKARLVMTRFMDPAAGLVQVPARLLVRCRVILLDERLCSLGVITLLKPLLSKVVLTRLRL